MVVSSKLQKHARMLATALGIAILSLGGGAMAANMNDPAPQNSPALAENAPIPAKPATQLETSAYATREAQELSAQLQKFQGGDTIIIAGSAVALVLVVVLLLVLL